MLLWNIAWKVSKYGVFSGPNTGKYSPEETRYLDTFHTVKFSGVISSNSFCFFKKKAIVVDIK